MNVKRLNVKFTPSVDKMLREIAAITKLKLVTILSNGVESEYGKLKESGK